MTNICPACKSEAIIKGKCHGLLAKGIDLFFTPELMKIFTLGKTSVTISGNSENPFFACLECGHLWTTIDSAELESKILKYGKQELKNKLTDY